MTGKSLRWIVLVGVLLVVAASVTVYLVHNLLSKEPDEKVLKPGEKLKAAIGKFEASRAQTSREIVQTTESLNKALGSSKTDLKTVAMDWGKRWEKVKDQVSDLEKKLEQVSDSADNYFKELEKLEKRTSDLDRRQAHRERNTSLHVQWILTRAEARRDLDRLEPLLIKGDDIHTDMLQKVLRQELEKNFEDLLKLGEQANTLLGELEKITKEGKKLTTSAPSD
jgi:DNA repair exonuclease SbcCD ATPase subunit